MSCDEWMRPMDYLCDRCARSKPRSFGECWCRNKVVRKKTVFLRDRPEDVCADFEPKKAVGE